MKSVNIFLSHVAVCSRSSMQAALTEVNEINYDPENREAVLLSGETLHRLSSKLKCPDVRSSKLGMNYVIPSFKTNFPRKGTSIHLYWSTKLFKSFIMATQIVFTLVCTEDYACESLRLLKASIT
jgi:hypothetical protein